MEMTTDYCNNFNSEWFLETYHGSVDERSVAGRTIRFALSSLHRYFKSDINFGSHLLDVGTGPTIWSVLSASRRVRHIVLSDFVPKHVEILKEWKDGKRSDVISHLKLEMELSKESLSVSEREAQIRSKVTGIHHVDVTKENIFNDEKLCGMMFDVITSSFCLETASNEKKKYIASVQNISKLLKPGGYLAMIGGIEESFYRVNKYRFPVCHLTTEEICEIYTENGFRILSMETVYKDEQLPEINDVDALADNKNVFTLFAQKMPC